jgi:thiol-disulfide isomerase/thioredoxin
MYKAIFLIVAGTILSQNRSLSQTQNSAGTGIQFDSATSWTEVVNKARAENKYIFLDCYTTWCGPCRFMRDSIFTTKEVGDYMNSRFISVAVQMDRTGKDNIFTSGWYKDVDVIKENYSVNTYPTYLIFSPKGDAVHRIIGGTGNQPDSFVNRISGSFVESKQYYTQKRQLLNELQNNKNDSLFLWKTLDEALNKSEHDKTSAILNFYLGSIKDSLSKDNIDIIERAVRVSRNDRGLNILISNRSAIRQVQGSSWVDAIIRTRINEDELQPFLQDQTNPDWTKLTIALKMIHPIDADRVIAEAKTDYYIKNGMIIDFEKSTVVFLEKYFDDMGDYDVNENAWVVFEVTTDKGLLLRLSAVCKKLIDREYKTGKPNPNYIDTYANILYKLGKKTDATAAENSALQLVKGDEEKTKSLNETLLKMKNGERTWDEN